MTQDVIGSKLEVLARILQRLDSRKNLSSQELEADLDQQDVVILNLERAVQACVDLASIVCNRKTGQTPVASADGFRQLAVAQLISNDLAESMVKAVGFQNLAVHEYSRIDLNIIASILSTKLADFRSFGAAMAEIRQTIKD